MPSKENFLKDFWRERDQKQVRTLFAQLLTEDATCPLCDVEWDFELRCVGQLQHDISSRPHTAAVLRSAWDLCNHHAWRFKEWVSPAVNATIFEILFREVSEALRKAAANGSPVMAEGLGEFWDGRRCPVCEELGRLDPWLIDRFVEGLTDPAFRETFAASSGLCVPHIQGVLARLGTGLVEAFLAACRAHLDRLAAELRQYHEKAGRLDHDYGELKTAPLRAIRRWAGNRGLNAWQGEQSGPGPDEPPRSE